MSSQFVYCLVNTWRKLGLGGIKFLSFRNIKDKYEIKAEDYYQMNFLKLNYGTASEIICLKRYSNQSNRKNLKDYH